MPTYLALRPMQVEDELRLPGDLVPEAATWARVQFWVEAGYIRELPTHEEFDALMPSTPEVEQSSTEPNASDQARAKGPHIRWHKLRGVVAPDCTYCAEEVTDAQG